MLSSPSLTHLSSKCPLGPTSVSMGRAPSRTESTPWTAWCAAIATRFEAPSRPAGSRALYQLLRATSSAAGLRPGGSATAVNRSEAKSLKTQRRRCSTKSSGVIVDGKPLDTLFCSVRDSTRRPPGRSPAVRVRLATRRAAFRPMPTRDPPRNDGSGCALPGRWGGQVQPPARRCACDSRPGARVAGRRREPPTTSALPHHVSGFPPPQAHREMSRRRSRFIRELPFGIGSRRLRDVQADQLELEVSVCSGITSFGDQPVLDGSPQDMVTALQLGKKGSLLARRASRWSRDEHLHIAPRRGESHLAFPESGVAQIAEVAESGSRTRIGRTRSLSHASIAVPSKHNAARRRPGDGVEVDPPDARSGRPDDLPLNRAQLLLRRGR